MKILSLLSVLFIAVAANADTYKCAETSEAALEQGRLQYSVIIKHLDAITDPEIVKGADAAGYVRVSILSRDPEVGGRFELDRPTFVSIQRNEDVAYWIVDRTKGFEFHLYLDENDPASVKIKGVKKTLGMKCSFSDK